MLSVIIPTHESERQVVRTLACLVAGATSGLVREVILVDAGSRDETEKVADLTGCRFLSVRGPLGARLAAAAREARGPWLMFLRPGAVLDPDWISEVQRFLMTAGDDSAPKAAAFRPVLNNVQTLSGQFLQLLRRALNGGPKPDHGLLLAKTTFDQFGGHAAASDNPERELISQIGRRRIVLLRAGISNNFG